MKNSLCDNEVDAITFEIRNSIAPDITFILFDSFDLVQQLLNPSPKKPVKGFSYFGSLSPATLASYIISNPLYISKFQIEFNPDFNLPIPNTPVSLPTISFHKANIDARIRTKNTISASTRRNTQFQSNLQTYDKKVKIDSNTGITFTLSQNNSITFTFYIEKIGHC